MGHGIFAFAYDLGRFKGRDLFWVSVVFGWLEWLERGALYGVIVGGDPSLFYSGALGGAGCRFMLVGVIVL